MIASVFIIIVIIVFVIYLLDHSAKQLRKYASFQELPGPSVHEILRMIFLNKNSYVKYHYLVNLTRNYGTILKVWIKPFNPIIIVADAEVMDRILSSKCHLVKSETHDMIKPFLKEAVGTTNKVELWKPARKICNNVFQPSNITEFLPLVRKHANKLLERLEEDIGKIVDLQPVVDLCALDIAFEFTTKRDQNFLGNMDVTYLNALRDFFKILSERMYSPLLQNDIVFRFSKYFKRMHKAINIMKNMTYEVIKLEKIRRKSSVLDNSRLHIIDVFFSNDFDINSLHDQINTFITAGHGTVAETLCCILYELSRHPKEQQKLYEEIASLVNEDGEVTNDILKKLTYLDAVVNETMRLHPAAPMVERKLTSSVEINGMYYPEGTRVVFSIMGIHTSSKYFQNPDEFNPDRFMPENAHLLTKHSFVPFSIGPRNCVGKSFAMLILKYFTARVIQQFVVLPDRNHVLKTMGEAIAKSITGMPVMLKRRCEKMHLDDFKTIA